ncbi:hypothetical protein HNP37_002089 [Flavobacterium nitrogenifigens]|uniref:Uncharacterized protein n=2 Tax=Flavobacterium TaxID=237 RepID=A0A7W7IWS7_9FLAO|nr:MULTISPECIES: hypothetical protein [Flavobacterium]MBB4802028.1 hypothetical protein [Flavobacterium nitrogenifigens]MBB6386986.1 hypothetical protein [Flavobacterium notoginsengisoli]
MTEIFPALIDSTCIDYRFFSVVKPPLYGKIIFDDNGNRIGIDTTNAKAKYERELLEQKSRMAQIEKDTSKLIIAFNPILKYDQEDLAEYFKAYFKNAKTLIPKEKKDTIYTFEYKNINLPNKFKLKDISLFPKGGEIWKAKYPFVFNGVIYFTRIQFDLDKRFGILNGGFTCGRHCGQGFRIFIKKINEKWIIDKVENTWVS